MSALRKANFRQLLVKPLSQVAGARFAHSLPALPYEYNALEPCISKDIMEIHHKKHHNTYVTNLNTVADKLAKAVAENNVSEIIALQPALKFNGGGHLNHSIFWEVLSPKGGGVPKGDLLDRIKADFGSFDAMKAELTNASVGIQGSGWGWLGFNPTSGRLRVTTCANQDPLQPTTGLVPLFGIDVWEHAYYLQYKNVRPDYVKAIFDIANWDEVSNRLQEARLCS